MTTDAEPRDRLQPALLDRLVRDHGEGGRVISKAELRAAVLRDLSWLFNAVQPHPQWAEERPALVGTVLNYGLPPLAETVRALGDAVRAGKATGTISATG